MRYAIIIEKSENGYGAYVPDLPGCVAVGQNLAETEYLFSVEFMAFCRTEGASTHEPRATPWERTSPLFMSPVRAATPIDDRRVSPLQGLNNNIIHTQGGALGSRVVAPSARNRSVVPRYTLNTYETEALIREAIEFHIEGLRQDGQPIPMPTTLTEYIEIAV